MSNVRAATGDDDTGSTPPGDSARKPARRPTLGFGVPAETDPHHFVVCVPRANTGAVEILESLGLQARDPDQSEILRVVLERPRWTAIRQATQQVFNRRLKQYDLAGCRWRVGDNPVDRLLGRELCVLAWAVEQMPVDDIPVAIRNWQALCPEERWWLFGMTAMQAGGAHQGNRGWRLALRYALGDPGQHEALKPYAARRASLPVSPSDHDLFGSSNKK